MSQVNVNPGGGYRDDAAAGWGAATIAMIVGFVLLFVVLSYFLATQAGWMQPVTVINQAPPVDRTNTTVIERQAPPSTSNSTSSSSTTGTTGGTTGTTGSTGSTTGTTNTTGATTGTTGTTGATAGR
jgi:hypothetical protein